MTTFFQKRAAIGIVFGVLVLWCIGGCTITELVIYKTVHQAQPRPTPLVKIGPS